MIVGRVTRFTAAPERFDEILAQMMSILARYEYVPEWLGGKIMADRESGEIRTVSYWPTRNDAEKTAPAAALIAETLSDEGMAGAEVKIFEVVWLKSPTDVALPDWTADGYPGPHHAPSITTRRTGVPSGS